MNCCDDFGQCQQGHGCPVRKYTCAQLGVCNCQTVDCQHCADPQPDIEIDPVGETPIERIAFWATVGIASVCTVLVAFGSIGYLIA